MEDAFSDYSTLFSSGLRAAGSSSRSREPTSDGGTVTSPSPRLLRPPPTSAQHAALILSPSRRKFAQLSPRRKTRSSFTTNVSSPLAGIKTPVKAAEVAARMQSMMLSPSTKVQNRQGMGSLPELGSGVAGAPVKPKPVLRARRLPPARKPPPKIPLPDLPNPSNASTSTSGPLFRALPSQPPFSPHSLPSFAIHPATPNSAPVHTSAVRSGMIVDDVFGSPIPYQPQQSSSHLRVRTTSSLDPTDLMVEETGNTMDEASLPDSSPMRGTISW